MHRNDIKTRFNTYREYRIKYIPRSSEMHVIRSYEYVMNKQKLNL